MGIGNTSAATAITAALTGQPVSELTGRGTGLDEQRCARKGADHRQGVALALRRLRDHASPTPLEILRCVGGLEIAAITGMVLGAASPVASRSSSTDLSVPREQRWPARIAPNARFAHHRRPSLAGTRTSRPAGEHEREAGVAAGHAAGRRYRRGADLPADRVGGADLQRDGDLRLGRSQRGHARREDATANSRRRCSS